MRIVQVVTLISPDGAFGGPVSVARGQAAALAARGHEVTLFAAAPVDHPVTSVENGYTLRRFPASYVSRRLGFAGVRALGLAAALKAQLASTDVAHVHLARDLVTLPAARVIRHQGTPFVVQTHGMIDPSRNPLALPVDLWETRPALRSASTVLALTDQEELDLRAVEPKALVSRIANGITVGDLPTYEGRPKMVLFLARLHPRKRVMTFIEAASMLAKDHPDVRFTVAGPDEGDGPAVRAVLSEPAFEGRLEWVGAVTPVEASRLMRQASVYVLPSVGEVFPMSVLEAFQQGTPTVVTESLGIAGMCRDYGAALVTDGSSAEVALAMRKILADGDVAGELRQGAHRLLRDRLDISSVAAELERHYTDAMGVLARSEGEATQIDGVASSRETT